jgi:hypothetical protein
MNVLDECFIYRMQGVIYFLVATEKNNSKIASRKTSRVFVPMIVS